MKLPYGGNLTPSERRILEQADSANHKRGLDTEIGVGRLILTSADGTRFKLVVANDGTLSATAV